MKRLGSISLSLVLGMAVLTAGCKGKGDLQTLELSPATASVDTGASVTFTATATWEDGSTEDVSADATWSSSDTGIATVDAGVATGVLTGSATIAAEYEGQTATATLDVAATTVISIEVTPSAAATLAPGQTLNLTATATYDDTSTRDISGSATWTSSDTAVATVADGIVTAVADGTTQVMASMGSIYSNNVQVTVSTTVTLSRIDVSPLSATLEVGETQQYTATGFYSDTSSADLTATVTWSSSDTGVAGIDAAGLATGAGAGTAQITANQDGVTSAAASLEVLTAVPGPVAGDLVINEFLVDGSVNQDANGDGTIDATEDEFLEIVNVSAGTVDLAGVTILENQFPLLPRHTFGNLRLAPNEAVVVFGGGDAPADTTGVYYRIANAQDPGIAFGLALTNAGDLVTLEDASGTVIVTLEWGGTTGLDAQVDQSLTLDPDLTGAGYVAHSTATGAAGAIFSPGTRIDGSAF